jgi:protoheme IX farnesyltransferase
VARMLSAYLELTKPRITLLVVLTAAAGFCLAAREAADHLALLNLLNLMIGVALLSSGIGALNQYLERDLDGLMLRTKSRPLPSRRIEPHRALLFGASLSAIAVAYMAALINLLAAALGTLTLVSYLFLYTPLKTRTTLSTLVGAFPGATPPLIGWVAARGRVDLEAWILFAIMFLWQFPHFLAIAWIYREDYARAGIKMLPVVEPDGRSTARQIVLYALMLFGASLLPGPARIAGSAYLIGAAALGFAFLYFSLRAAASMTRPGARKLLLASVLYLPALFVLMVASR